MKKLLFILLGLPALGFGQWTEEFDASDTLPAGWKIINQGDDNQWAIQPMMSILPHSGQNTMAIKSSSSAHDDYLITRAIDVQAGISDRISFYVTSETSALEKYKVLLSTTDQNASSFTNVLQTEIVAAENWTRKSYDLSAYAGQTVYVAIYTSDMDKSSLHVDTFSVDALPDVVPLCTNFTSPGNNGTNVSREGILSWTPSSEATGYKIKVGTTSGGTEIVNNVDVGNVDIYDIPGILNSNTTYYASVIPYNNVGNATNCSEISFKTVSVPLNDSCSGALNVESFPYTYMQSDAEGATNNEGFITACSDGMNDGTWFTFTGNGEKYKIDATPLASKFDVQIGVYSGTCSSLVCEATVNDDGIGKRETILIPTTAGKKYYVNIGSESSTHDELEGNFMILIAKESNLVLGVSESAENKKMLEIYPNPFTDVLTISKPDLVRSVSVSDVSGRLVKIIENPSSTLHLGDLKQGLYFVTLNMKDGSKQMIKAIKK